MIVIEMPVDSDLNNPRRPRGHASQEKCIQEEREQTALSAMYMTPTQIPDSPAEPSTALSEEEVDKDVKTMQLGDEMENLFYPVTPAVDPSMSMNIDSSLNVSQLIGQLSSTVPNAMDTTPHQAPTVDVTSVAAVQNLRPDQLQQLLAQISSSMGAAGQQQLQFGQYGTTPSTSSDTALAGWGSTPHHFSDYTDESDKQYLSRWEEKGGRGGRGPGAGRGSRDRSEEWNAKPYSSRKSRPCLFFQQQRRALNSTCVT
jgi:protein phosphatase 1 regulatory subunit 10